MARLHLLAVMLGMAPVAVVDATDGTAQDTLRMRIVWDVTPGRHPTADSLGELSGLALDRAGLTYVSDFQAVRIWVFDPQGRSRPPVGRQGEGPGEYQAPTGLAIDRRGRLAVRDIARVTYFAGDPRTGTLSRYDTAFTGPTFSDWRSTRATRISTTNELYYPGGQNRIGRDGSRRIFYYRYTTSGRLLDTALAVPSLATLPPPEASVRLSASSGRILRGLSQVAFAPRAVWDVTPEGTLIVGDGTVYRFRELDAAGRELRSFSHAHTPLAIPARERQDSLRALRERLDTLPVPADRVEGMPEEVRQLRLPTHFPPYQEVYVAEDGVIWVRRWVPAERDETRFDLFSREGVYRRAVVLPRRIQGFPTPVLREDVVVGVVVDPETGEYGVIRFGVGR